MKESGARMRWVFKQGQELFGPVPTEILEEKLRAGELGPETLVAREHGPFAPIGAVEPFVALAARLATERRQRVEAQRRRRRLVVGVATLLVVGGLGGASAWRLLPRKSAALEHRELRSISIEVLPMVVRAVAVPAEADEDWEPFPNESRRISPAARGREPTPRTAPRSMAAAPSSGDPVDEVSIETRFDAAAIEGVVARNRGRLLRCLRAQAEGDPHFRGEIPLSFVVGNDGRVARLWVDRTGYRRGPLHDCLLGELRTWDFPRFEGQRPAIALRFQVGG